MDVMKMKRKDFDDVPKAWHYEGTFDSFIVIPTKKMHDSGFQIMEFVLCNGAEPIVKMVGCVDSVHLDGIGGYGQFGTPGRRRAFKGCWNFDCLPCGYIRMWSHYKMTCGAATSDFSIFREESDQIGNNY